MFNNFKSKLDLFQGGAPEVKIDGKVFYNPYEISIKESIFDPFRTGKIKFFDIFGIPEFASYHNTTDKEKFVVSIKNAFEQDKKREIRFGLYNMTSVVHPAFEGRTRNLIYDLIEEPIFSNFYKKVIRKSFKDKTAKEILEDLFKNEMKLENIESKAGKKDPKIPLFISPFWKMDHIYEYLRYMCDEGPFIFFPYSKDGETKYKLLPLQQVVEKGAYEGDTKGDVAVAISSDISTLLPIKQDYVLASVCPEDKIGLLAGHTIYKFDYFNEKGKDAKKQKDFAEKDKSKYKWEDGEDDYKLEKRNPMNVLSGSYEHGSKDVKGLGEYSFYLNKEFSTNENLVTTDIRGKKLLEKCMLNQFYESFYSKLMIQGIVVGHENLKPGQIVTINVPSTNQQDDMSVNHDESLKGDWLITEIEHHIHINKSNVLKYEPKCTFIRTGLEKFEKNDKQKLKGG